MKEHRLTTELRQFVLAGNATFTIRSTRKDSRLTYKVQKHKENEVWFVKVRQGHGFEYLGFIKNKQYIHGRKSSLGDTAPETIGFRWLWRVLDALPADIAEFWHEGTCGACGRQLTVPESIATGIGPQCAKAFKMAYM